MTGVRIVTDSACDLAAEDWSTALGIEIVPADDPLRRRGVRRPRGAQRRASSTRAWSASDGAARDGGALAGRVRGRVPRPQGRRAPTAIVCINLSSQLSATMQSAQIAAKAVEGDVDVRVVDSKSITCGLGHHGASRRPRWPPTGARRRRRSWPRSRTSPPAPASSAPSTPSRTSRRAAASAAPRRCSARMLSIKPIIDISAGVVEEAAKLRDAQEGAALAARQGLREPATSSTWRSCHGNAPDLDEFLDLLRRPLRPR